MKIKEYRGINTKNMDRLHSHVETLIRSEFQPFGGISIAFDSKDELWFSQAMVKYEEENTINGLDKMFNALEKDIKERKYCRQPFLDWQENRPDNKPKPGSTVLIKMINGCLHVDYFNQEEIFSNFEETRIVRWSYIPE